MKKNINDLLVSMNSLSEDEKYSIMYSILTIRSVKEIPGEVFNIVNAFMSVIALASQDELDSGAVGTMSLMTCQLLSLGGYLKNIPVLPEEALNNILPNDSLPDNWEEDILKEYKAYIKKSEKGELFIKALGKITNNEYILCAASNFVYYQTKFNLTEDEQTERSLGLVNLIKLCINKKIVKELQGLLKEYFDISLTDFLSANVETFISTYV